MLYILTMKSGDIFKNRRAFLEGNAMFLEVC